MTQSRQRRRSGGSSSRGSSHPRRAREWFDTTLNFSVAAGGQGFLALSPFLLDDERKGATIVRTLIDFWISTVTANVFLDAYAGITFVTDDALSAGVLPDPSDDTDQPGWMWKKKIVVVSTSENVPEARNTLVDLRSMRKFPGESVNPTFIIDSVSGAFDVDGLIRMLVLKP